MIFIDTHTHIYLRDFRDDRDEVINAALEKGIKKMLLPNIDGSTVNAMHSLCERYPESCLPMIGLHPTSVDKNFEDEFLRLSELAVSGKYWGIGETGIDLYREKKYAAEQEAAFLLHVGLARKSGLPIIIHARESFDELFRILDRENDDSLTGIFHAFTGTSEQAEHIIGYGFKIGIGGILTFKNSGLADVVRKIDPVHLVLETDAPYLAPVPLRGKRNEPAYLVYTAGRLAEIFGVSLEAIANITTRNAASLFNIHL